MTRRRFFVSRFRVGRATVDGEAARHLARVLRAGFVEASLGGTILRAETAGLDALAILRYELAD